MNFIVKGRLCKFSSIFSFFQHCSTFSTASARTFPGNKFKHLIKSSKQSKWRKKKVGWYNQWQVPRNLWFIMHIHNLCWFCSSGRDTGGLAKYLLVIQIATGMKTEPRGKTFKNFIFLIIAFVRLTHAEAGLWKQEEKSSDFASRLTESQIGPDPQSGRGRKLSTPWTAV